MLRRFLKTATLKPGAHAKISFDPLVAKEDMSIWSESKHDWEVVMGKYGVMVGASSADIRLRGSMEV